MSFAGATMSDYARVLKIEESAIAYYDYILVPPRLTLPDFFEMKMDE
ncbi:hypothetical protein NIES4103_56660 [Nostoc sp. NIES-4103]|nr:hypothetical protein NIES4103_56660 [Nostoc sp. NIES-4103]